MDERHVLLLARAERALANRPVAEAVGKVRAIVGIPNAPDSEKLAQAAIDKLRNPSLPAPTPVELAALEFVIRMMRPAPLSKAGELQRLPSTPGSTTYNPATEQAWNGFCAAIKPYLYSIGRLDRTAGSNPEIGTGFLVAASDLLLTNHHVLAELSHGADALQEGQATVTFYQEYQTTDPPEDRFPIVMVVAIHPTLDLALLKISSDFPPAGAFVRHCGSRQGDRGSGNRLSVPRWAQSAFCRRGVRAHLRRQAFGAGRNHGYRTAAAAPRLFDAGRQLRLPGPLAWYRPGGWRPLHRLLHVSQRSCSCNGRPSIR